jgi:hypothetical protein
VAIGDFNNDGKPDLAAVNRLGNSISVLLGTGIDSGLFVVPAPSFSVGQTPVFVATGDFNSDGRPDLAVANSGNNKSVSVSLGFGDGSFGSATHFAVGTGSIIPNSVAIGDFNGDGKPDLATANAIGDTVSILLNK